MPDNHKAIQEEFERSASGFAERTVGRFDGMDVPGFARVRSHESVLEIGAGTGNFLKTFEGRAARRIALDLTSAMLQEAGRRHEGIELVQGDGVRLPFRTGSVDLVASAQMLHHVSEPVPILMEMRRIAGGEGRILVVDQHATERYEEQAFMNQLEVLRDPTHAVSRPPSAFRVMLQAAALRIVDERLWEGENRLSQWMWPGEFPPERIAAVRDFIERFGSATGMEWRQEDDDWVFTRRRIMLLATVASSQVPGRMEE